MHQMSLFWYKFCNNLKNRNINTVFFKALLTSHTVQCVALYWFATLHFGPVLCAVYNVCHHSNRIPLHLILHGTLPCLALDWSASGAA